MHFQGIDLKIVFDSILSSIPEWTNSFLAKGMWCTKGDATETICLSNLSTVNLCYSDFQYSDKTHCNNSLNGTNL